MDFSEALEIVKQGTPIYRDGWNRVGLHIKCQFPDDNSKMTLPYLYIEYPCSVGDFKCPWVPSHTDIMAEDWRCE